MSLLPNLGSIGSGVSNFYNGAATTSYRNASTAILTNEADAPTSAKIMSFGGWVKKLKVGVYSNLFSGVIAGSGHASPLYFDANDKLNVYSYTGSAYTFEYTTNRLFRDPSAWYHIWVQIDSTASDIDDRVKIYVNGVPETSFATETKIANGSPDIRGYATDGAVFTFGHADAAATSNSYFADWYFIDGSAVSPVDTVGEFKNGVFIPKAYSPTFGTNGFHLKFDKTGVGSADETTIGADSSGKNTLRHFISTAGTNVVASDCALPDSPENNFATWNPLSERRGGAGPYATSHGNLRGVGSGDGNNHRHLFATMPINQVLVNTDFAGVYFEVMVFEDSSSYIGLIAGEGSDNITYDDNQRSEGFPRKHLLNLAGYYHDNLVSAVDVRSLDPVPLIFDDDYDILGFAIKSDGKVFMSKNGTFGSNGTGTQNPANGTNPFSTLDFDHDWFPHAGNSNNFHVNFGQDHTFSGYGGNSAGGGATNAAAVDASGHGTFFGTPPTNFVSLCTANMKEPDIGPNSDAGNSTDFFDTVLYAGNDTDAHVIPASGDDPTSINFTPDWLSIKTRSGNDNHSHFWINSSKGATKFIKPDATGAEGTDATLMKDIGNTENTWRMGGANTGNGAGTNHVAWLWKNNGGTKQTLSAGSNASTNSNQVNQTAGISFNSFTTSTRDASDTVFKHGLGVAPDWIMLKAMESNNYIAVYSAAAGGTNLGLLGNDSNSGNVGDDVWAASNGYWGTIDATNVTFQDNGNVGSSGEEVFAWCFAAKEGFSKFGFYEGNGSADGVFIYTGFRPAFVMIKSTTVAGQYWVIKDTRRDPANPATNSLYWNTNDAEGTGILLDILSNGFKPRTNGNNHNNNGGSYVYMAFAEQPFKYANAR